MCIVHSRKFMTHELASRKQIKKEGRKFHRLGAQKPHCLIHVQPRA